MTLGISFITPQQGILDRAQSPNVFGAWLLVGCENITSWNYMLEQISPEGRCHSKNIRAFSNSRRFVYFKFFHDLIHFKTFP